MTQQAIPARTCAYCLDQFVPANPFSRYCSAECTHQAFMLRLDMAELPLPEPPDKP